jgi:hypothetical protein
VCAVWTPKQAKGKENVFKDKLWDEDTTWPQALNQEDQVAADHSLTPQGSELLKIEKSQATLKGEFVDAPNDCIL